MNWSFDGKYYTNRDFSRKILRLCCAETIIAPFSQDLGVGYKRSDFPATIRMTDIVRFSSFKELDEFNLLHPKWSLLYRQLANRIDALALLSLLNQTYAYTFTGKFNKFCDHDEMDRITHCKPYEGINYVGLAYPKQMESIMQHPSWEFWHQYSKIPGDFVFKREMGKIYNIRWVEVPYPWLPCPVVFGDKALARFEIDTPHLRANLEDKTVAVYGNLQFARGWGDGESPRIVHLKTIGRRFAMRIGAAEKYRQVVRRGVARIAQAE